MTRSAVARSNLTKRWAFLKADGLDLWAPSAKDTSLWWVNRGRNFSSEEESGSLFFDHGIGNRDCR